MKISFRELPFLVRLAMAVSFFNAWLLIGELVIDRHGLAHYFPFYRVGNLCAWDIAIAILLIATLLWPRRAEPAIGTS